MSYIQDRLGNHIEILSGYAYKSKDFEKSGIPVIKIKNVTPPCVSLEDLSYVSEEVAFETKRYILNYADVLIALTGSHINQMSSVVGRVARINFHEKAVLNQRVGKIIPFSDCDLDYVYYYLSQEDVKVSLASKAGGAANQANISPTDVKNLMIPFPDINIQSRISSILRTYDDLIENNQRQIKLLEEAAQRLYKEWFVDLRYPGHENVPVVDGVPEGWKKVQLSDVLQKMTTGLNPRKNFVLGKGKNYYVTIKNMGDNNVFLDDKCDKIDDEALEKINKRSDLRTGDILFSGIGTIGRVYLIGIPTHNWNVSESVFTMRANERITNAYLYMVLLSNDLHQYCDHNAHGVAQKGIRMADLNKYTFLLPSLEILQGFTDMAWPMIQEVQGLQKQINNLSEARDRLLPKLMSGEIAV